jgi:hypothetical protein
MRASDGTPRGREAIPEALAPPEVILPAVL